MPEEKKEKIENKEAPSEDEKEEEEDEKEQGAAANELIDKANKAAERIEKANDELKINLAKQETMKVEDTLGGTTKAGTKQKTEEEKEIEGAKELLKDTGLEDAAFPNETDKKDM